MMNSSSFESTKPYLFGQYLKDRTSALLRYLILAWTSPTYNEEQNKPTIYLLMKQNRGILRCPNEPKTIQLTLEILYVY